jgi:hypothetical protein
MVLSPFSPRPYSLRADNIDIKGERIDRKAKKGQTSHKPRNFVRKDDFATMTGDVRTKFRRHVGSKNVRSKVWQVV